jgi:hypothetical protein
MTDQQTDMTAAELDELEARFEWRATNTNNPQASVATLCRDARKAFVSLRKQLDEARERKTPDFIYDPEDWECTNEWCDRELLVEDRVHEGKVHEFATLVQGPPTFAAYVVLNEDEDGEWQWFESKAEAEAAMAKGLALINDAEDRP